MTDRLTELQDCLDQLATQFYASLRYITTHHPSGILPTQPTHDLVPLSPAATAANLNSQDQPSSKDLNLNTDPGYVPSDPVSFDAALRELAQDLVLKQQQIELLIGSLPSIESGEQEQEERIKVLAAELREAEKERGDVVGEKEEVLERLDRIIAGVKRF